MDIKNILKKLLKMIYDNFYLLLMMTGIWLTLIVLFVFIKIYVVPLAPISPLSGYLWDLITAGVQALIAVFYCLGALYIWFRLIKTYFWRRMKKSGQVENNEDKVINK